jgi:hypothetical protein
VTAALSVGVLLAGLVACSSDLSGDAGETGGSPATSPDLTARSGPDVGGTPSPADLDTMDDLELATTAYVGGYPLVVTMRTLRNLGALVGTNALFWQTEMAGPASRVIVAPNRDTFYSVAVLDLRAEPMVLTLPEITDRYVTYQFLDAWTDSFAYLGTRQTGGRAGTWIVTPPGWTGQVPNGMEQVASPTPQLFLLGRLAVQGEGDVAAITAISAQASLQPLSSALGQSPPGLPPALGTAAGPAQAVPADASFFDELLEALAVNPPSTPFQQALFEELVARFEFPVGGPVPAGSPAEAVLDEAAAAGDARIEDAVDGQGAPVGGWGVRLDIGRYGDDLLGRALVARVGWGANVDEEAVYPLARVDASGDPLSGEHTYRITFPPGGLPPVDAFWSLSVYGDDLFFTEHPSGRYTTGSEDPELVAGPDGSVEIVLAHGQPTDARNWLPVPAGPFVLMLRLYLPGPSILDGSYDLPPIERVP